MSTPTIEPTSEDRAALPKLLTRQEAADYLGVSAKTMANWASSGLGPQYYALCGGVTRYDPQIIHQWLQNQCTPD